MRCGACAVPDAHADIAVVDGILILLLLYFNDHPPAHFHAQGADFHARIRIDDGEVLDVDGRMSPRQRRRLKEWYGSPN
jgi:hypothetical protein